MARYQVTLSYDGTHFFGFQRQGKQRTVQLEVETALQRLGWQGRSILSAGRTDSGVHASGQVIAFELNWAHLPEALGKAMNANLPADVAVKNIRVVQDDFHPRYDARVRKYQYSLFCAEDRDPLLERYAWRVWPAVDLEILQKAAQLLIGTHNYSAFGTPPRAGGSTVRTVFSACWAVQASGLLFEVSANAFLYHMVRRMVYLQVLVGQDRLSMQRFAEAIQEAQLQTPGLAPPNGLVLAEVRYALSKEENQVYFAEGGKNTFSASGEDDCGKDLRH